MNSQREKPGPSIDQVESRLGQRPVYLGGGQIENFREGWAQNIMGGDKVHFYKRAGFVDALSLCGNAANVRWLYGGGNYPKCKTCLRIANRNGEA